MRRSSIGLLALAATLLASADARSQDFLEPETGGINEDLTVLDGYRRLREALLEKGQRYYQARVICRPSTEPTWVVTLTSRPDEETGKDAAFHVEFAGFEPVGQDEQRPGDNRVRRARVPIDRGTADAVRSVWMRMLRATRYREGRLGGADGVDYHFSRAVSSLRFDPDFPPGFETGTIWSPDAESLTGQLTELGKALKAYALASPEERGPCLDAVREKAGRLKADLDNPDRPVRERVRSTGEFDPPLPPSRSSPSP